MDVLVIVSGTVARASVYGEWVNWGATSRPSLFWLVRTQSDCLVPLGTVSCKLGKTSWVLSVIHFWGIVKKMCLLSVTKYKIGDT